MEEWTDERWFRGAFRYYIPTGPTLLDKFSGWMSQADHLLGVKLTPEVLWNIGPWSWAVDWFTNTGDIMKNISNLGKDGLVMQYGYSMATRSYIRKYEATFNTRGIYDPPLYRTTTRETSLVIKQRRPATPYGFGTNLSTLSPKQIAIMTALGLSKT